MEKVVLYEVMIANTAIRNLIREDRIYQIPSIIQSGGIDGMQSLDQDLQRLVSKGEIERKMAQSMLTIQNYLHKIFYDKPKVLHAELVLSR